MSDIDRLYNLLPSIYRIRDADQGYQLRALLRIITEQVDIVEEDISQLYENWFIETCQDWVVPYIGDLIGYNLTHVGGNQDGVSPSQARSRKILIPRKEVANTIRYRRRKGTLAVLAQLAEDVTGWQARAVEPYRSLAFCQNLNYLHMDGGRTVDLRNIDALDKLNTPFDELSHLIGIRRSGDRRRVYNINEVDVFIWRMKAYSVSSTLACPVPGRPRFFMFNALGYKSPLYGQPDPSITSGQFGLPMPISRWTLQAYKEKYYGKGMSLHIAAEVPNEENLESRWVDIDIEQIIAANLKSFQYALEEKVAIDPENGLIAFPSSIQPTKVKVSYYYGFSDDIGGGEYDRLLSQPLDYKVYAVGQGGFESINDAIMKWKEDKEKPGLDDPERKRLSNAVIELLDSGVYEENFIDIELKEKESLQIRAANHVRAVVKLVPHLIGLRIKGDSGSSLVLDGLLIMGASVSIEGNIAKVALRHSTIVPGTVVPLCHELNKCIGPSININGLKGCLYIDHSIIGPIEVDEKLPDSIILVVRDSIIDAINHEHRALGAPRNHIAPVELTIQRSTILGKVLAHAIKLAENTIFWGILGVARSQIGCMRFCYITPGSRTPRRFNCQPDGVSTGLTDGDKVEAEEWVRPKFNSIRYSQPGYCRLAEDCADEIKKGADDESEMGVFHDLYQPQREANLRIRLEEFTPADMDIGVIFVDEEENMREE